MAFGQYDGSIRIDTSLNTKNFNAALGKITNAVKKLGAAVGVSLGIAALVKFGKEAIDLASDIEEVQNVVDTAFGSMSGMVDEFASTAIEKLGMSELAAKQTASTYMAMSKGMGMYGKEAAQMAIDAAARTGDIASFYNMTQQEADTMLKSIWTGETESLKRIGVVMTQTNLDQYALQKGFGKTTSKMNQQELTLLRYQYVMEKTGLAAGDFEKTQDSWANQTRVLTERWKQFLSLMGTGLIQILTPALKFLNQMMSVLMRFAEAFSKVTAAIFGKQTLSTAQGAQSAVSGAAGATDEYADSVANAKKQQDKFLAGLDEITTLNEPSAPSASATASAPSSVGAIAVPEISGEIGGDVTISPALQKVIDTLSSFFENLKRDAEPARNALSNLKTALEPLGQFVFTALIDFYNKFLQPVGQWVLGEGVPRFVDAISNGLGKIDWENINNSLGNLWDKLSPFAVSVGDGLLWFWENVLVPLGTWVMNDAVPAFLDLLAGAIKALTPIIDGAKEGFKWLWDNFLQPMISFAADNFIAFLQTLADKLTKVGDWFEEHPWIAEFLGTTAAILATVAASVGVVHKAIAIAQPILNAFLAFWSALNLKTILIVAAIAAVIAIIVLCVKHWDEIKEAAARAWDWIKEKWNAAGEWFRTNVTEPIQNFFTGLKDGIQNAFSSAWDWIKGVWDKASTWVNDKVIVPIANFFSGLWDGIKNTFKTAFDFIKHAFKTYVNGWISIVENFINFFIKAINLLIKGLNKISFDIPDWVPSIGGRTFGFNIREVPKVSIPRLATGAVIPPNAEFAAILGDQKHGRNLEAPEGLIRQIVKEESGANLTVILQMPNGEEKEVFSTKHISKINRQSGRILIPITEV